MSKISNVSKNSTTRSNNASLKLKRAEFQATNDPNLEIALALSASMAAGTTVDDSNALKSEKVEEINDESGKQCWLPQVRNILIFDFYKIVLPFLIGIIEYQS